MFRVPGHPVVPVGDDGEPRIRASDFARTRSGCVRFRLSGAAYVVTLRYRLRPLTRSGCVRFRLSGAAYVVTLRYRLRPQPAQAPTMSVQAKVISKVAVLGPASGLVMSGAPTPSPVMVKVLPSLASFAEPPGWPLP